MLPDTGKCARCQIVRRLARNDYATVFYQMFELTMTAALSNNKPIVLLDHAQSFTDLSCIKHIKVLIILLLAESRRHNAQLGGGCRRSKAEPEAVRCSVWFGGG